MKDNKRRGIVGFFVFLPLFLFFTNTLYYDGIQFLIRETDIVDGKLIDIITSPKFSSFYYTYSVDSEIYKGHVQLFMKYGLENNIFKVRYLISDPSKSIIDGYILRQVIIWGTLSLFSFFFQFCFIIVIRGKSKWLH